MKQETLFKISLIISVAGIFLLLLLANFLEPKLISIQNITIKMLNEKVKIQGSVLNIEDKETFKILTIKDDSSSIEVLCECKNISSNQNMEIIGKVQEYEKTLQLQADKIIKK